MAKYTRAEGIRSITGDDGYGWLPVDGAWVRADHDEPTYTLEKRRRNPKDGTHTTGWYLYDDVSGGFFGEFTSSRILEAVDTANDMIARAQKAAEQQHEVQAPAELDDEDAWDEPRSEVTPAEAMTLRPGAVVEARRAPSGARVRVRLGAAPTNPAPGIVTLKGVDEAEYDVDATSVVLIGVMPRKGQTIHAQAKTYTTPNSADELPEGTRVRCAAGANEGRYGTVNGVDIGRVNNPEHKNHGRAYVGVNWDAVAGDMGANRRSRPFVDELRVEGLSKPMRRKLDRAPWAGNPGSTVISDGRGVDAVLTSTITILAGTPGDVDDELRLARVVQLAMPGLDFHTNTTSVSSIRVYANKLEGEGRDDEAVLARNDDIAEAIVRAGFHVARRGVGQAVYASTKRSEHPGPVGCQIADHKGEPAPWVAVISAGHAFEAPYACRACVRRLVEGERALNHADPERPYLVRMWDAQDRTLKVADDAQALDFRNAESRDEARTMAEQSPAKAWRDGELVPVHRVTVDRLSFYRDGELRDVELILENETRPAALLCNCGHPEDQHQGDEGLGGAQCRTCPGDGERSWRHPFTPEARA